MSSDLSFNLCSLPPWVIASRHFNENPQPLQIQGVREANRFIFQKLDDCADKEERARIFCDYLSVKFSLHHQEGQTETARRSLRNSYLRFLKGWMMDANSVEGAVLKAWVESRFGIAPLFHNGRIQGRDSETYYAYLIDRTRGSRRTSAINSQLDLLYEFCQYELQRTLPGQSQLTLFRGTHDASDHDLIEQIDKRTMVVRLNNLVSFTFEEERAWEFGTTVWKVIVPLCKVFFYDDLLPNSIMKGEGEYMVVGGDFLVSRVMCTIS